MSYSSYIGKKIYSYLTPTVYKYLDVGIVVGPTSFVEIIIGDNQSNNIILSRNVAGFHRKIRRYWAILVQSIAPSLSIHDLVIIS